MKKLYFILTFILISVSSYAQNKTVSGTITDALSSEPLIGATVIIGDMATVTDFDGKYSMNILPGEHIMDISYVGFAQKLITITVSENMVFNVELEADNIMKEVTITADIAIDRETPVAFSNIPTIKIEEELAAQDIPMLLNSTPGTYATQSGGGDGDARITIRGFNQRNIAVMLDGIPVNDMENGWVYWSNWFGLDLVTQTMQVQRGLGASKLSVPSVGGTVNILTKGIDAKKSLRVKQEIGNNGFFRSTLGLTSGRLESGWAFSAAASYKQGNGWVDGTFTKGLFYYLRIDKQIGNHFITLSGFGAPQEHGQRPFTAPIGQVDTTFALEQGVPQDAINQLNVKDRGRRYNEHWGMLDGELVSSRKNYYHKPQYSLRHSWQANEKTFWSNVAYLSIGKGGGTAPDGVTIPRTDNGQIDFQRAKETNESTNFAKPDTRSEHILRSSHNEHFWYGLVSTMNYNLNENWTISSGIDARYYRGDHFRSVYDLLGGSYFYSSGNFRIDQQNTQLQEGDRFDYDYSGFVRWAGLFGLAEYKKDKFSGFINLSTALSGYRLEDYMKPKIVELADTSLYVSFNDPVTYQGTEYTINSSEAKDQTIDWVNLNSFTFKTGAAYDLTEQHGVFVNTGYLSKAQRFNNVIEANRFGTEVIKVNNFDNENIIAFEAGYNFRSQKFSANVNSYYTIWENKPLDRLVTVPLDPSDPDSERLPVNIPGIDALHKGIEIDFAYKPFSNLSIEGLASIGDWRWTSGETATVILPNDVISQYEFDADGVHVGDAAQTQFGGLVRYEPIKDLYLKLNGTYFGNNYADFQPENLRGENGGTDSWQLPSSLQFSFHAGKTFKSSDSQYLFKRLSIRANVLNLFDTIFVTDARNNDTFNTPAFSDFDAKSASVHFGQGRRFTLSIQGEF